MAHAWRDAIADASTLMHENILIIAREAGYTQDEVYGEYSILQISAIVCTIRIWEHVTYAW